MIKDRQSKQNIVLDEDHLRNCLFRMKTEQRYIKKRAPCVRQGARCHLHSSRYFISIWAVSAREAKPAGSSRLLSLPLMTPFMVIQHRGS